MFTRSVVAWICGGVLIGMLVPGGLGVTPVHAQSMTMKKAAKVFRERGISHVARALPPRARKSHRPADKKVAATSAPARLSAQSATTPRTPARHLGTFAVRAYTHYQRPPSTTATGAVPTADQAALGAVNIARG